MSRAFRTLVAVLVLGAAVLWLAWPGVPSTDIGPADRIVARAGVDRVLVSRPRATPRWWSAPVSARGAGAAQALPVELTGVPALTRTGDVVALTRTSVLRFDPADDGARLEHGLPEAGGLLELVGLDGADEPVLLETSGRVHVRDADGWLVLADGEREARVTGPERVVMSPVARAVALRADTGWEVWSWEEGVTCVRVPDLLGANAVFSPDGVYLVVDGPTDGLFRLDLLNGGLEFMARGNLGHSRRVPFAAGFRGDPPVLVAPQRDMEGILQVFQTQLVNQMRMSLTTGAYHHYAPALSPDGGRVAYLQAPFEEDGDGAIVESLYVHDFERGHAVKCLSREAVPRPGQGPVFAGTDGTVVALVADGRALLVKP